MTLVVHCQCGADVSGETEEEIVSAVESHVQERHPEQIGTLSRDDILAMAHEH
jgi:predicted small metal-binding protein